MAALDDFARRRIDRNGVAASAFNRQFDLRDDVSELVRVRLHFDYHVWAQRPEAGILRRSERIDTRLAHPRGIRGVNTLERPDREPGVRVIGVPANLFFVIAELTKCLSAFRSAFG